MTFVFLSTWGAGKGLLGGTLEVLDQVAPKYRLHLCGGDVLRPDLLLAVCPRGDLLS